MTALFEMHIRVGGDPRGSSIFVALREELAKLSHPACPDVDWAKVEQLCLALFEQNGVELNSACFYALARGQRQGVDGVTQGMVLLQSLCSVWQHLWPPTAASRLDLLGWLFEQLQLLLRGMALNSYSVPGLIQLDCELAGFQARLLPEIANPLLTLAAMRYQVGSLVQRLEQYPAEGETRLTPVRMITPGLLTSVVILPPPDLQSRGRRVAPWLFAGALTVALMAWGAWLTWLATADNLVIAPDLMRLDSLSLFAAGSATLKPDSTRLLVDALVNIKAQPGRMISIVGHTDRTGDVEQNIQLSYARAVAVRDWMKGMGGLADSCFTVQGAAGDQPIASNDTAAGRDANRRVDIQLVTPVEACVLAATGSSH